MIAEEHLGRGFRIGGDRAAFQRRNRLRENEGGHFIGADFEVIDGLLIERERLNGLGIGKAETQNVEKQD